MRPTRIGALPSQCLALNRTFLNVAELTVRAVVEGSRELVYRAAMLDPNTGATLTTSEIVGLVPSAALNAAHSYATEMDHRVRQLTALVEDSRLQAGQERRVTFADFGERVGQILILAEEEAAQIRAIAAAEAETGLTADDPVRFGPGRLVDAVLAARSS